MTLQCNIRLGCMLILCTFCIYLQYTYIFFTCNLKCFYNSSENDLKSYAYFYFCLQSSYFVFQWIWEIRILIRMAWFLRVSTRTRVSIVFGGTILSHRICTVKIMCLNFWYCSNLALYIFTKHRFYNNNKNFECIECALISPCLIYEFLHILCDYFM